MRSIPLCFILLAACTTRPAPEAKPAVQAVQKATYGQVTEGPAVSPSQILAKIDSYDGQRVRVEGTVAAVCQHRGCWMDIAGADGAKIRIKVRDGEVVFPKTATGKRVIAEGIVVKIPADPAADKTSCGQSEEHGEGGHEDCSRPAGASARLDGFGAVVFEAS